jgi:DUF1680 family protein
MKTTPISLLLSISVAISCANASDSFRLLTGTDRYEPVSIRDVHLTDDFWLPIIETVQEKTIAFALEKCEEEGRMENFLIAGGKMEGKARGAMPFDDTDVYKIIEGASNSLISAPNPDLEKKLDDLIDIIAVGQEADGYITTWRTIDGMHPTAPWVEPGERWHHLAASHELYNAGHLFEAAAQHYAATGKSNMLKIATGYADLLVETFGKGKKETVPGHQIVETGLIKLYRITGKKAYLDLAKYFLDERGHANGRELFGSYSQDHVPVVEQDEVVGHAVRAVYMYAGMTDIAELYQDQDYFAAVNALWKNMVNKKLYITGGIGARHEGESFGENYELPNLTAYAETCAAIGSVIWNHRLFQITGKSEFYDVLERTLYNGTISGISLDGTHFFYPNCLESDGEYAFNRGNNTRAEWFDCSCCPSNLIRFLPTVPGLIYEQKDRTIVVNLYASNQAEVIVDGDPVTIEQQTHYPWDGNIALTVNTNAVSPIDLKLRIPGWARNEVVPGTLYQYVNREDSTFKLRLNGQELDVVNKDGYVTISRVWKPSDVVNLELPMSIRVVKANEKVEDLKAQVCLERGPIVYCFESPDNETEIQTIGIGETSEFRDEWCDELGGIVKLIGTDANGNEVTAIPYYAWSNRGVTKMRVWTPWSE